MKNKHSTSRRFWTCVGIGIPLSIVLGVITGLMREHLYSTILYTWVAALLIAIMIRDVAKDIRLRFAFLALILTYTMLYFSDLVYVGSLNQLNFFDRFTFTNNYIWALEYPFVRVENLIRELLLRAVALYGSYHYARVI